MFLKSRLRTVLFSRVMSSNNKSGKFDRKVAIVTASTDGIGFSIAKQLAVDGAMVMVSSRKQNHVDEVVATLQRTVGNTVCGTVCHVGKEEDRKRLIEETLLKFGKLDILVSNAAVNPTFGPTLETTSSAWDKIWDINVKSTALLVKEAYPHLKANKGGSIVIVSSIAAYSPFSALGPYSVSKTALIGLTKVLAQELAPDNIRVNCIAPGIIRTKFSTAIWSNDVIVDRLLQQIPQERLGEPSDCAGAVSFLCSDAASYITGETIVMSGGMQSRL